MCGRFPDTVSIVTSGPVEPLLQLLTDAALLLEGVGEQHWAAWLRGDLGRLRRGDGCAIYDSASGLR
jgi:hypothetical protein